MESAGELKHVRVRRLIQDLVAADLQPGDALMGERQLEDKFGVSRITIRRAISDLVQDGALVRIKGKGTFVSHGLVQSTLHLASFNEDMRAAGFTPSTRVITATTAAAPPTVRQHLGLPAGATAYKVQRVRMANGAPVSVDESWLPPGLLPDLLAADLTGSLYRCLAATGNAVQHAEQTVEAAAASAETAGFLDIEVGAPVLLFKRRSFAGAAGQDVPIEYTVSTYRSDRYQVSMRLGAGTA